MAVLVVADQGSGEESALVDLAVAAVKMLASVGNASADGARTGAALGSRCATCSCLKAKYRAPENPVI